MQLIVKVFTINIVFVYIFTCITRMNLGLGKIIDCNGLLLLNYNIMN